MGYYEDNEELDDRERRPKEERCGREGWKKNEGKLQKVRVFRYPLCTVAMVSGRE